MLNWPVRKDALVSSPPSFDFTFVFELHVVGTITVVLEKSSKPRFFHLYWCLNEETMAGAHFLSCLMPVSLIAFSGSPESDQQVCFKTWTKPDGPNPVVYLKEPKNWPYIGWTEVLENRVWLFEVLAIFSKKMFFVFYSVWSTSSTCLMWDSSWRENVSNWDTAGVLNFLF